MLIVIGISFNLLIIRIDQGTAVGPTYMETGGATIPLHFRSGQSIVQDGTEPRRLQVKITTVIDHPTQGSQIGKDSMSEGMGEV
jgi:hypothetical protein